MPLMNFGHVGVNMGRCAQPDAHGFTLLREMGYTLIAKLNTEDESSAAIEAHLFDATDGRSIAQYPNLSPLHPDTATLRAIAEEILRLEAAGQRVLLHCTHGRDRTGMVAAAIRLIRDRWPIADVLDEFAAYGLAIAPIAHAYRQAIRRLDAELTAEATASLV
jgi:tyrosine-protein phosphatase SIW14